MFKIGDFVRCVENNLGGGRHLEIGQVYKVVRVNGFGAFHIRLEGVLHDWRQGRFILWEPQVGDEVVLKKWEGHRFGQGPGFPNVMDKFVGEITTISSILPWSVRVVGNDCNWDKEWGIEPNYHGRQAAGGAAEAAIIEPAKWIPKAGDRVIIESNPDADWMSARLFDGMIGEEHVLEREHDRMPGWWTLQDGPLHAYIHISGLRLVVEGAARPLEEPVRGFNERVKGMVAEAKKKAQKPVKQAKPENKLAEYRAKLQAKATSGMAAAYAICFSDGTALIAENTACHAGLNVWRGHERGKCVAVYDHIARFYEKKIVDEMKPSFKKFFTFLVQRSPIAHAFITKNFEDALKNGVSMDVSKTGDEIAIGCCSLRFAHEHEGRIDVWDWAIKNGFNMLTAYFLMNVAWKSGDKFNLDVRNWHNIVDGDKSFQGLIEGMANGWHDKVNKPYAEEQSYRVSKLVHNSGKNGGYSLSVGIKNLAAYTKGNDGWGGVPAYWNEKQFLEVGKKVAKLLKEAKEKPAVNVEQQQAIIG